jgi:hypothetical protein
MGGSATHGPEKFRRPVPPQRLTFPKQSGFFINHSLLMK